MLGAGVFVVWGPASKLAGNLLLIAVLLAATVAALNARSIQSLAKEISSAGGAYAYGRKYLSPTAGFLAGAGFIIGKIGSVASIALTAASYLFPDQKIPVAIFALLVMTVINILGINRTALGALILTSITVGFILFLLMAFVANPQPEAAGLPEPESFYDVFVAASLIFFAFAGYARVATLGEEVKNPKRNVPRAMSISLSFVLILYAGLAFAVTTSLGENLQSSQTPLLNLASKLIPFIPSQLVVLIAASASLGSLLALLAGISRTSSAMARDGELPRILALRNKRFNSPWVSQLLIAFIGIAMVSTGDVVWTIGISSFCVLIYYAIGNLAALRLGGSSLARALAIAGFLMCLVIAFMAPLVSVLVSVAVLMAALLVRSGLRTLRTNS